MEFGSALGVLLRRWIVVVVGGILTVALAGFMATSTPPSYRATANLLLLLPRDAGDTGRVTSPYLYLPTELNVLARLVAAPVPSQAFADEMESRGLTSPYEVGFDPRYPIITVGVEGPDPENVVATRDGVVTAIEQELADAQSQEDVPPRQTARARVYAAEETPTQLGGSRIRVALAVVAAGGLLTLLAAFGVDGILARRRSQAVPAAPATTARMPASVAKAPSGSKKRRPRQRKPR